MKKADIKLMLSVAENYIRYSKLEKGDYRYCVACHEGLKEEETLMCISVPIKTGFNNETAHECFRVAYPTHIGCLDKMALKDVHYNVIRGPSGYIETANLSWIYGSSGSLATLKWLSFKLLAELATDYTQAFDYCLSYNYKTREKVEMVLENYVSGIQDQ